MTKTLLTCPKCTHQFIVRLEDYVNLNQMADLNKVKWQCPNCKTMIGYNWKNAVPYYEGVYPFNLDMYK